jgi:predicted nucleotide-binding protein
MAVTTGNFRALCGASIAYGLTEGGYNAAQIALTPLGRRIVAPTDEGDDEVAMREACLIPQVVRNFLTRFNGRRLPPDNIAHNVLEEMGVPRDKTERALNIIIENARSVGFIREIKGNPYVDIEAPADVVTRGGQEDVGQSHDVIVSAATPAERNEPAAETPAPVTGGAAPAQATPSAPDNNRVFISHGKNKDIVAQLKELLGFGKFDPVVSVEKETVSKPVPDKVMEDMRSCFAAIIHVGKEMKVMDAEGNEHIILNQNVLIEIGAAMALYGRRFILLVEKGATLPSNLQGLYEVRYEGERLDYDATMRLLKAFNDFRS